MEVNIQPKLLMEEKAINLRKEVWFNPPKAPMITFIEIIKIIKFLFKKYDKIIMGVIFCHVIKIKLLNQDNPSTILGNQKWKGDDPIFISIDELIINDMKKFISKFFKKIIFNKIENKKLIEAIDWVKKYFKDASLDKRLFELEIRGINLKRLISNPIQHPNHEFEEIAIKVLKINI